MNSLSHEEAARIDAGAIDSCFVGTVAGELIGGIVGGILAHLYFCGR